MHCESTIKPYDSTYPFFATFYQVSESSNRKLVTKYAILTIDNQSKEKWMICSITVLMSDDIVFP
jgi:hypothetical protein